jgi:putative membrane protein
VPVTAAARVGEWDWSLNLPLVLCAAAAILYRLGATAVAPHRRAAQRLRSACFYAALAVLLIALSSPLDGLSEQLFWAHMVQHVLLLLVAAPLVVIARPWNQLWRCLPLGARRPLARGLSHGGGTAPLRAATRFLGTPATSFALFAVVLLAWHLPVMFDATLRSSALHELEHSMFFLTAILFFKQVIPSPPLRISLSAPQRVLYAIGAMVVSWVLAIVLALAQHPLYAHYAHERARPGGLSALGDQHVAAGIMWVPGSITFLIVVFVYVHRWLMPSEPGRTGAPRLASER